MQISLYVGRRKKKDKIVNGELLKYIEGDRSDRIKDLILKGLIFEGKDDIDEKLLDMRYMYDNDFNAITKEFSVQEPKVVPKQVEPRQVQSRQMQQRQVQPRQVESRIDEKPDFSNIKIKRREIEDEDLERRI